MSEPGDSSESSIRSSEHSSVEDDSRIESSGKRKCFSESDQVGSHHSICAESKCYRQKQDDLVTASSTGQIPPASVYPNRHVISNDDGPVGSDLPQTNVDVTYPSSAQHEEPEGPPSFFEEINGITGNNNSDSGPIPLVSDPGTASRSRGDDAIEEVMPSGLEHPALDRGQAPPEGSLIHVDLVSISSDVLPNINNEISVREARRNNRRAFLDAFSSRSSRRHADFPAILFTAEDADLMGSHRRWLLDIGDDFFDDGVGVNSWHLSRRNRVTNDRWNSRSEFWDRLRVGAYQSSHHTSCPFDLHPDGSCSCELEEESIALSSISRIVLLAEALFEVLDEIHRQPESFSLSLPSVPAPESVVDSLPLQTYTKTADCGDDVDQCHICLVEYEEGDRVRVLPCQHEYHMSCVDKWLKEVHGVCPLCRGDVRGVMEGAASSSSGPGPT